MHSEQLVIPTPSKQTWVGVEFIKLAKNQAARIHVPTLGILLVYVVETYRKLFFYFFYWNPSVQRPKVVIFMKCKRMDNSVSYSTCTL